MKLHKVLLSMATMLTLATSCVQEPDNGPSPKSVTRKWSLVDLPLKVRVHSDFESISAIDGASGDLPVASEDGGEYPEYDLFEEMQVAWNNADQNRDYFVIDHNEPAQYSPYQTLDEYYDDETGIYLSNTWFPSIGYGVLAITSYFVEVKKDYLLMKHGDIIVNLRDYYYSYDKTNTSSTFYDLPTVILHELGHLIGLYHADTVISSVMFPQLGGGEQKRELGYYDSQVITGLYANTQALSSAQAFSAASSDGTKTATDEETSEKPKIMHGYIELRDDGNCNHYLDGKLIEKHKAF